MSVSIHIEPESGVAVNTCSGVLRIDDARKDVTSLWNHPDWNGKTAVWDYRDASFELSNSDIRQIASFVAREQPAIPPTKVAFVTPNDIDFGLSRVYEAFRKDPRTEFRVFRDIDEALEWARSPATGAA